MRRGLLLVLANTFKYLAYPFQYIYHSLVPEKIAGFNIWDEEWEAGSYNNSTGEKQSDNSKIRSKNLIPVIGGQSYYFKSSQSLTVLCYDQAKSQIKSWNSGYNQVVASNQAITLPANCVYIVFYLTGTTYNHNICINVSNANVNGKYLPYSPYHVKNAANVTEIAGSSEVVNQLVDQTLVPTGSSNGVTFTNNDDGSFTATGTASAYAYKVFPVTLIVGNKYLLFGAPSNTNSNCGLTMTSPSAYDYGSGVIFTANQASVHVYMFVQNGYAISGSLKYVPQLINLTQEFPFDTPSSVSDRRVQNIIANGYRKYNTGTIVTSNVGLISGEPYNIWDEEWEQGYYNPMNGNTVANSDRIRSKNFISVIPNTLYCISKTNNTSNTLNILYFKEDKTLVETISHDTTSGSTFTTPSNCYYIKFYTTGTWYGGTYNHDICINRSSSLNGTYAPYRNVLPVEYQEVEYIESTGTQYIDTGYIPNSKTKIIFDCNLGTTTNSSGVRQGRHGKGERLSIAVFPTQTEFAIGNFTKLYITPDNKRHIYELDVPNLQAKLDGVVETTFSSTTWTNKQTVYLFARNTANGADGLGTIINYNVQISESNVLVRNFIPCYRKSDNVIGLFDTVQNKFYTNSGTGTFLKGKDTDYIGTLPFVYQGGGINTARNAWQRTDTEEIFTRRVWDYMFTGSEVWSYNDGGKRWICSYSAGTSIQAKTFNSGLNMMTNANTGLAPVADTYSYNGWYIYGASGTNYIQFRDPTNFPSGTSPASIFTAGKVISYELNTPQEIRIPKDYFGFVDLGTLNWELGGGGTYWVNTPKLSNIKIPANASSFPNIYCERYATSISASGTFKTLDKVIAVSGSQYIYIRDSLYPTDGTVTAADFKKAMAGVYLFYETSSSVTPRTVTLPIEAGGSVTTGAFGWVRNQLVTNGDFTSTSNWIEESACTLTVENNIATMVTTVAQHGIFQLQSGDYRNHQLLFACDVKGESGSTIMDLNVFGTSGKYVDGITTSWQKKTLITSPTTTASRFGMYPRGANNTLYVKNCMVIDLTLAFGSGNEPTSVSDPRIERILDMGYIPTDTTGAYEIVNTEALPNVTFKFKSK